MRKEITFYVMRHGFCNYVGELTPEGREGIEKSAEKNLTGIKFGKAYSSDKIRAWETMKVVLNTTGNSQLGIEHRKGLNLDEDSLTLREIKSIAREVSRDAVLDGRDDCNVMVVTHSANILACSRALPTLLKVNNADIVKIVVKVTNNSEEIVTTQYIPR